MTKTHQEALSAGMDGELSRHELRFLLRRLDHETDLARVWERYHLARASMRHELSAVPSDGFSARVMEAVVARESLALRNRVVRKPVRWLRWSAGSTIAASVALAALMLTRPVTDGGSSTGQWQTASLRTARPALSASMAGGASRPVGGGLPTVPANAKLVDQAPAVVPPWLSQHTAAPLSERTSMNVIDLANSRISPYYLRIYRSSGTADSQPGSQLFLLKPLRVRRHHPASAAGW